MTSFSQLDANLGGEEGAGHPPSTAPAVRAAGRLWSLLFARSLRGDLWPPALGAPPERAAFDWLDGIERAAWWEESALARSVHDKAFAWRTALAEGLVPACLRDLVVLLEPGELGDAAAVRRAVEERVRAWPPWTRGAQGHFVLKPRIGSSGRGRVRGWDLEDAGPSPSRAAFTRLAARGGAILEPWLEREQDLSAQLRIDAAGTVHALGELELRVTRGGTYRGHLGRVDPRGGVGSGGAHDGELARAAAAVGRAASAAGYRGPAGLDAFAFRGPGGETVLRPVVELNARFTMGTVALGLLRRALDAGAIELPAPGDARAFAVEIDSRARQGSGARVLELDVGVAGVRPVLVYARDAASLVAAGISSTARPSSIR